jgi:hypothetical protein
MVLTHFWSFALDGELLFFAQPKKSNQKKGCPSHFLSCSEQPLFNAPSQTLRPCTG